MSDIKDVPQYIEKEIASHKVMIFSKSYCPFCVDAKKIIKKLKRPYHAVELDEMSNGGEIQKALIKKTRMRTVPQIFIDGEFIGGCSELQSFNRAGKLVPALEKAFADGEQDKKKNDEEEAEKS